VSFDQETSGLTYSAKMSACGHLATVRLVIGTTPSAGSSNEFQSCRRLNSAFDRPVNRLLSDMSFRWPIFFARNRSHQLDMF
jgi:hypothetical protein